MHFEFGEIIIECLSDAVASRSTTGRQLRTEKKLEILAEARDVVATQEQLWPSIVPQSAILRCLNEYTDATVWTDPPICAVCSQYAQDMVEFSLSQDLSGLNLELLQLKNEHLIKKCVVQGLSTCFLFGHDLIDRLMLDHQGIV
jgi:hypothetical protein